MSKKMPRDHYVAQTYLKNFSNTDGFLIPYYKKGQVILGKPTAPKSVCYKIDGNTNTLFDNPRALEEYIEPLEKNWNSNLQKLRQGTINFEGQLEISAYLSFLRLFTPTAIRQSQERLAGFLKNHAKIMAEKGMFYNEDFSPEENQKGVEMILKDQVTYEVDPEHAQAKNINILDKLPLSLATSDWKVLFNDENAFLASDNPFYLFHPGNNPNVAWLYAPLTPDMAVIIRPDQNPKKDELIKNKQYDQLQMGSLEYGRIAFDWKRRFNRNLVRYAEEKVFSNRYDPWIERLVNRNKSWRAETTVDTLPTGDGYYHIFRDRVVKKAN